MPIFHWETITGSADWQPSLERMPVDGGVLYRTTTYAPVFAQQVTFAPTPIRVPEVPSHKDYEQGTYDTDRAWLHALCEPLGLDPDTGGREQVKAAVERLVREWADLTLARREP